MRRVTKGILGHKVYTTTGYDRYGVPIEGYAEAVDFPVYSVTPKQSVETDAVGRRPIITGLTVLAPVDSATVSPQDRFTYRGKEWSVEGDPGAWDMNPHVPVVQHSSIYFDLERSEG